MQDLLEKIKDLDIRIHVKGNDLKLSIPEDLDCGNVIEEIREHKEDLINFIQRKTNKDFGKVVATNLTGEIKLTPAQRQLFILHKLVKDSIVYNTPMSVEILGTCNKDLLEQSMISLIQRHEILRTEFKLSAKNTPVQVVKDKFDFKIECFEAAEKEVDSIVKDFVRPFDFEEAPLVRACLIQLSEERSIFVIDMHHIVTDGVSQQVFIQELLNLYGQNELAPNILQFKDYVSWYYSPYNQNRILNQRSFWLQELSKYSNDFKLPTDFPRERGLSFEGKSMSFDLGVRRSKKLNKLAQDSGTSPFIVLLSLYGIFLSKLTQVDDIVIGTPVANRMQADFQNMIGMIVNTLPIRVQPRASLHFKDYLKIVSQKTLASFDNQEYVYEELIKDLDLNKGSDANPLFDVLISMNGAEETEVKINDTTFVPFEVDKPTAKFDLSLHFAEKEKQMQCVFEYRTNLYAAKTIKRYFEFVKNIIDQVVDNQAILLKDISLVNEKQSAALLKLNDFSETDYPKQSTIVELFEKQVAASPDNVALVIDENTFTYGELNTKANQIAWKLRGEGVERDTVVGLFMEKSFDLIAGILGVLKAGGAYLPIDLAYPASRINYLIENSAAKLVLTNKKSVHRLEDFSDSLLLMEEVSNEEQPNLPHVNEPNDLCYIIYTSGTTGNPKGVMVEHRNLVRLLFNNDFQFEFSDQDTWTMFHSASFDFSVWEMYGALLYGGKLVVISPDTARNPFKFKNIVQKHEVTVLNQTPTAFYNFIRVSEKEEGAAFPHLRYVIFGGEELAPAKLMNWYENNPDTQLINMYGITEMTVHVTFKKLDKKDLSRNISNIGKPVPTNLIYVLDKNKNVVPQGSIGELYVGGEGVSRGYLNNPELTASRFIQSPFNESQRLYKTGDVARLLGNGELEYLGRNDRQVQIKGFRIELGEIEYQLEQNEWVKRAIVVAKKDEKYPWICAYVIMDNNADEEELREYLSHHIPYYMVPNYFMKIDTVPYTSNFKVDYKKLPAPNQIESSNYVAPSNEQQKTMSDIWLKHLAISKIGVRDNFFAQGGDSIRALSVISDTNEALNSSFEIADIYAYPTIEELCNRLTEKPASDWVDLKAQAEEKLKEFQDNYKSNFTFKDEYEEVYPMNGVEKGMVFHSLAKPEQSDSIHDIIYHEQNIYLFSSENFELDRFKKCLKLIAHKHSALRKIFDLENLAHIVLKDVDPEVNYIDVSNLSSKEQEAFIAKRMHEEKLRETELDFSLFWRMTMFKVSEVNYYLLFDFHHSLIDGWSLSTLLPELYDTDAQLSNDPDYVPEPLQTTYRDQVITEIAASLNEKSTNYWKNELDGFERLKLYKTGLPHKYHTHYYDLGKDFRKKLERVAFENNTNLKHLCFAAYIYMMKMYTGMNDLTVGLVTNNRPTTKDGEKLLGCFLNTIPFRAKLEDDLTWGAYVNYVESKLVELKRNDNIPLHEIVNLIDENVTSDNPIFNASFNYIDFHVFNSFVERSTTIDEETGFRFENYMNNNTIFDLIISAHNSTFGFVLQYSAAVLDGAISSKLFEYFKNVLHKFVDQLDAPAVQNEVLPNREKDYLLGTELNPEINSTSTTSIMQQFERQVAKTPSDVAVVCGSIQMTYAELYQQSKRVSDYLRTEKHVEPGDFIGIKLGRSEWPVIALLGVLQARACYVPIDPEYPEQRIQFIEQDSQCKEIIDADWIASFLEYDQENASELEPLEYQVSDKAYMIYTSGSTGNPKGVAINNSNLDNYVTWAMEYYMGDLEQFSFPFFTSLSFDLTQTSILLTLLSGGELAIYGGEDMNETMKEILSNSAINVLKLTPSHLQIIEEDNLTHISNFILGGEALLPGHVNKIWGLSPEARIFNEYGPTEATIGCTCVEMTQADDDKSIHIGRPIDNMRIYILNDQNQLTPHGGVGELCVAGEGVSHGYHNRPELNQRKFIADPYSDDEGQRMYRTGDLAKWRADGNLELIGRKDDQVKIRGYRIELGEIISCIDSAEMVAQNIVVAKKDSQNNNILVAYVVPQEEAIDTQELKDYLKGVMPKYLVPDVIIELEELPLTQNGKIDKEALLQNSLTANREIVAPQNEVEEELLEIWKEVLSLEVIGMHDNFFELGGHSLLAIMVLNKIQRAFKVKVPMQELFNNTTLASLSKYVAFSATDDSAMIKTAPVQEFYPLSSVQNRQYFVYQIYPESLRYNTPVNFTITGKFDIEKLEEDLTALINRHTILKTCFKFHEGNPAQCIKEDFQFNLKAIPCLESEADGYVENFVQPFNLADEIPIRMGVLKIAEDKHVVMTDIHHIVFDEVSRDIMLREMLALNTNQELPPLQLQYKDYAVWQQGDYYRKMVTEQKAFWLDIYSEPVPALELPTDYARPVEFGDLGHYAELKLTEELTARIRKFILKEGSSMFNFILAAYNVFLTKLSKEEDVVVGITISGRQHADLEDILGMFVNTLALRNKSKGSLTFKEFLAAVQENSLRSFDSQFYPYEDLIDELSIPRVINRNPLFDVFFAFSQEFDKALFEYEDFTMELYSTEFNAAKFDITLSVIDRKDEVELRIVGRQDLFKLSTIERFMTYLTQVIDDVLANPDKLIDEIEIVPKEEKEQLLSFNKESEVVEESVVELFAKQVQETPDNIALEFKEKTLTYRELDEQSNQLAKYLNTKGIAKEDFVGIVLDRSEKMIISVMAVLKAGAAYVPIDPGFPEERVSFILDDANINWVLSTSDYAEKFARKNCTVISLDKEWEAVLLNDTEAMSVDVRGEDLMYVIYTSGSTGRPKGVMLEHRSLVNLSTTQKDLFNVTAEDRILQFTALTFDVSVSEILMALLNGAALVLVEKEVINGGNSLISYMEEQAVSVAVLPPAYLKVLDKDKMKFLRCVITVGEAANVEDAQYLSEHIPYYNAYGPTECAVYSTVYKVNAENTYTSQIPIGKPLDNLKAYIIDENNQLCPVGVIGELCMSGVGVARGYLNRPELTNEKFIVCPFDAADRMYRTGDFAKWNDEGQIEFIGRQDDQVKIRGYRIELGEIETVLEESDLIKQVSVQVIEKGDAKHIAAYVVPNGDCDIDEVYQYLSIKLPAYMKPSYIVALENIPLTSHGKVDRKALIKLGGTRAKIDAAPKGELEIKVAELWKNILDIEEIGVEDNFFKLGGNSLLAIRTVEAIRTSLNCEIRVKDIFIYPTIRGLCASAIKDAVISTDKPILKIEDATAKIPLSYYQEYLWIIDKLNGSLQYHLPVIQLFGPELNPDVLQHAMSEIVNRHASLRSVVKEEDGVAYQEALSADGWKLKVDELDGDIDKSLVQQYIAREVNRPFDLTNDYNIRGSLFKIGDRGFILVMTMHHIAADAQSINILVRELSELSFAARDNRVANLPPITIEYSDYAVWQRAKLTPEALEDKLLYWENKLEGVQPVELPYDYPRSSIRSIKGDAITFKFDQALSNRINDFCNKENITPYIFLLSAFKVLLFRYTGQEDICVGTPISNRRKEVDNLIGFFINTVAVRSDLKGNPTFNDFLNHMKENMFEIYEQKDTPIHEVINRVVKKMDPSIAPLFQILFQVQNAPQTFSMNDLADTIEGTTGKLPFGIEELGGGLKYSKFDLSMTISDREDDFSLDVEYCTDLFKASSIEKIVAHYQQLVERILDNQDRKIGDYDYLTNEEVDALLELSSIEESEKVDKSVVELFAEQVEMTPDNEAIVFNDETLTYRELDEQSNQLARYLQTKGIGKEEMVGLFLDRSVDMIVGLLATLKVGAAYVPINLEFPDDRIEFLLKDAGINWVLSHADYTSKFEGKDCNVVAINEEREEIALNSTDAIDTEVKPDDLMYVIYTSGSTGRPKGVMLEHRSLANLSTTQKELFNVTAEDRVLQFTTLTFDVSVSEILMALLNGAALVLVEKEVIIGGDSLVDYMEKHEVSVASLPPAYLKVLDNDRLKFLRCIITAGEAANVEDAQYLCEHITYYNAYGPTECAVYSSAYEVDAQNTYASQIPIGKPLGNLKAYVVDKNNQLCPAGITGELCISGAGVARGYLNRPELTNEKFITCPFDTADRMYKTGDYAKWNDEGQLEFIGRRDDQVKIRGFRIELGEIEATLDSCDLVKQATVQVMEKGQDKNIVAYIVPEEDYDLQAIQMYLENKLPAYMKPAYFMVMDSIPLTAHGKVDRKFLPNPDEIARVYTAPSTATEEALVSIWSEVLQLERDKISADDRFFELGGNSLKAILLINKISKAFSVTPSLRSVFQYPDLQSLGAHIDGLEKVDFVSIPKASSNDYYPLSSAQQRIYFLYELDKESTSYNMPTMFKVGANFDINQLEFALKGLVARHQSLRTQYELKDGQPVQRLVEANLFSLNRMEVSESEVESKMKEFIRPFDLSNELPYRVTLLETAGANYTLMMDMHHIAGDGVSTEILIRDFWTLYKGDRLEDLKIQYVDYSAWQQGESYQTVVEEHKEYWMNVYSEEVAVPELPTDHNRPSLLTNEGYRHSTALSENQSEGLRTLAREEGVTMYTLLLGVYNVFLQKLTNEEDIVVGTPTAGRHHADLEGIVGMFVNTLTLRNNVKPDLSFKEFLAQAQDHTISAFDHQLYQYEDLVEALEIQRTVNRNPLFDVFYSYGQRMEGLDSSESDLDITPYAVDFIISKFDLNLVVTEGDVVNIGITGRKDLFEPSTMERFVEYLSRVIDQVLSDPTQRIEEINLLSKEEKEQLLSFNQESETSKQAEATAEVKAIVFKGKTLTYRELHANSSQLVPFLKTKGIGEEDMAGLLSRIIMEVLSNPSQETEETDSSKKKKLNTQ